MNREQREIIFRRDRNRCALTWEMPNKTADHIDGRFKVDGVKADEFWDNLWTISKDAHWQKDNADIDSQIKFIKRLLPSSKHKQRLHEVLKMLEDGKNFREIGREYAAQFKGQETPEYLALMHNECKTDAPKRKAAAKTARQKAYKKAKAKKTQSKGSNSTPLKRSALPQKVIDQQLRPVLNG